MAYFNLPNVLQAEANALPEQSWRAGTVFAAGQHQNIAAPWVAELQWAPHMGEPASQPVIGAPDPIMQAVGVYQADADLMNGQVAASQQLNFALSGVRLSGSLSRSVSVSGLGQYPRKPLYPTPQAAPPPGRLRRGRYEPRSTQLSQRGSRRWFRWAGRQQPESSYGRYRRTSGLGYHEGPIDPSVYGTTNLGSIGAGMYGGDNTVKWIVGYGVVAAAAYGAWMFYRR